MVSNLRPASVDDLPALRALAARDIDESLLTTIPGERYMLVLDDEDGLAAATHFTIEDGRGHVRLIAIADHHRGEGLESRLVGVIESLCEAFGVDTFDVPRAA
ncbi:MAG TPA: hypothetical protein VK427_04005 [Kofleriaceae bacterium]|nr:hypothetical protein [Kofleriaceae bacterium]